MQALRLCDCFGVILYKNIHTATRRFFCVNYMILKFDNKIELGISTENKTDLIRKRKPVIPRSGTVFVFSILGPSVTYSSKAWSGNLTVKREDLII